ncbi:MAG: recombinase [Mucilaginibacter sp.]|nr:recombinase [Mucilaginibacter sp.]
MPTFKPLILKHQQKEDGTFNVKIRITHNRESKYIATGLYIKGKQVTSNFEIKDRSVIKKAEEDIDNYWEIIKRLPDVSGLNVSELLDVLEKEKKKTQKIEMDFVKFSRDHIEELKLKKGEKYAASFNTTINSLCDFFGRSKVLISEITTKNLTSYVNYLKSERTIIRNNQFKKPVTTTHPGMGNGAQTYLTNIRTLFNAARFKYNDEDEGIILIPHYPFRKYKLEKKKLAKKRNVKPSIIKQIIGFTEEKKTRATFGRDVFMISFYMLGTNLIDLYEADTMEQGRIMYNRSKTEGRREDSAFISIKIESELLPLLEQYKDKKKKRVFCFYQMYSTSENFIKAVNIGLKKVANSLGLPELTTYYARHSWATIARNNCAIPKEDITLALNHIDTKHRVTDSYLETDWHIIDNANRKVLGLFRPKLTPEEVDVINDNFFENHPDIYLNLDEVLN